MHVEAYTEKTEAELKERLTMTWLGEYYHRMKRLPKLQDELKKVSGEKTKTMTDGQMLEMAKRLNAQFGGTVKKVGD